jgi:hypothetical protein
VLGQITHTPLLIDLGDHAHLGNKTHFSFELPWFENEGFSELVAKEWAAVSKGDTPIITWQNKIRHLCRFLRGWAKNISGKYKKENESLLSIIDFLDVQAESCPLNDEVRLELRKTNEQLNKLGREEEIKWAQRAKIKHIQEGGNTTKYFHLIEENFPA